MTPTTHSTRSLEAISSLPTCQASPVGRQPGGLLEWQNAAVCARGRLRPDGYGLIRLDRREFGFFLEFDRGTVRPAALRAKFAAYVRYGASSRAAREYAGLPCLVVVAGQPEPAVFFTTTALLTQDFSGAIWRRVGSRNRCRWPKY